MREIAPRKKQLGLVEHLPVRGNSRGRRRRFIPFPSAFSVENQGKPFKRLCLVGAESEPDLLLESALLPVLALFVAGVLEPAAADFLLDCIPVFSLFSFFQVSHLRLTSLIIENFSLSFETF